MSKISIDFKTGKLKNDTEIVVGIDLGTTNSLIACTIDGRPHIIPIGPNEKKACLLQFGLIMKVRHM